MTREQGFETDAVLGVDQGGLANAKANASTTRQASATYLLLAQHRAGASAYPNPPSPPPRLSQPPEAISNKLAPPCLQARYCQAARAIRQGRRSSCYYLSSGQKLAARVELIFGMRELKINAGEDPHHLLGNVRNIWN
jgi:hypothetical protein